MSEAKSYCQERVERLLKELQYEVTRGMLQGELPSEHMGFRFFVPVSKEMPNGIVACEFQTRPVPMGHYSPDDLEPRLRVVK